PPVTTPVRKRRRDLGCAVCCAPADPVSSGVRILYSFRCDLVVQLPLRIKHTSALLLEFVAPVKFCKAVCLVLPVRHCPSTHLQLVTSASFTYTEAELLALHAVRRRHDPDPKEHARGEASDAPHLYGDNYRPGGKGGLCRARLPAGHARGDCAA